MVMANTLVLVVITPVQARSCHDVYPASPNVMCIVSCISLCCIKLISFIFVCDKEVNMLVLHNITQLLVQMVNCDWWEVTFPMKAEWRSVSTMSGALCVMTTGTVMMPLWCADS